MLRNAFQSGRSLVLASSLAVFAGACTGSPLSPSETAAAPVAPSAPVEPQRPEIANAIARLNAIGRPVRAQVVLGDLPPGVHAYAQWGREITVSREWLDSMVVSADVLAGVLSHEQWHLDNGPHTCADGRRDVHGIPGAWQYHSESLRLLGAASIADVVASSANYCQ
ncbi:MAG: hypothetical protein AB7F99_00190 [Vicinamibacterales bacterium]